MATVQDLSLAGTANGVLLAQLEGNYDGFVTADVELPTNRLPILKTMMAGIALAATSAPPGSYIQIAPTPSP